MDTEAAFVTYVPPAAILVLMVTFAWSPWDLWRILGAIIVIVFLALLTVARRQLGNSFSITAEARNLVTTGIYSRLRHPVYVFSSVLVLGLALYFKMPWLAVILIIILPMQFLRARQEEKILTQAFGEAYLAYRKTTWF
ncbi:isoprenylcysteine carboxylmethyltransferase family protein [Geothrix sp.]|jgi:protein-S-isoprenylcysteine O-methyltransferase Ste14|uniref:methyltransferase family protein n=1 Tax=Geothrix sp. TaxID=1962974 RepID=UPI0025BD9700|nr:isoprenylcysteine carboxylmethyltransferase family protein [Geothrix sp.]